MASTTHSHTPSSGDATRAVLGPRKSVSTRRGRTPASVTQRCRAQPLDARPTTWLKASAILSLTPRRSAHRTRTVASLTSTSLIRQRVAAWSRLISAHTASPMATVIATTPQTRRRATTELSPTVRARSAMSRLSPKRSAATSFLRAPAKAAISRAATLGRSSWSLKTPLARAFGWRAPRPERPSLRLPLQASLGGLRALISTSSFAIHMRAPGCRATVRRIATRVCASVAPLLAMSAILTHHRLHPRLRPLHRRRCLHPRLRRHRRRRWSHLCHLRSPPHAPSLRPALIVLRLGGNAPAAYSGTVTIWTKACSSYASSGAVATQQTRPQRSHAAIE
mmetsp:Transcript_1948/g.3954  ORF Transcript_1948/g.3954 Transcript_1948/m.3954 type:complete len:337 (+) Transcript_1948:113-1123(+)